MKACMADGLTGKWLRAEAKCYGGAARALFRKLRQLETVLVKMLTDTVVRTGSSYATA